MFIFILFYLHSLFACRICVGPIKYGKCYMYAGCRDGVVVGGSFVCWLTCDFVAQDPTVGFDYLYCCVVFGS